MYTREEVNIVLLSASLHQVKMGQDTEFWQTQRVTCIQDRREHSRYIFSRDLFFLKEICEDFNLGKRSARRYCLKKKEG